MIVATNPNRDGLDRHRSTPSPVAVSFDGTGSTFRIGARRTLVQSPVLSMIDTRTHYDITRDGKRLLIRQPAGPQEAGLSVILNWTAKLK